MRIFGRRHRPDPEQVAAALSRALGQPVTYNHLQYRSGAVSGVLEVPDLEAYRAALATAHACATELLGDDAQRTVFYLSAATADGTLDAGALGLPVPPSGRDLAQRFD